MICAWEAFLSLLPPALRRGTDLCGKGTLQELRLRLGMPPELRLENSVRYLSGTVTSEDLHFCINAACRYSPWNAETAAGGFLTGPGGHRIGICGEAVHKDGRMTGFRAVTSLCLRVARDFPGIAEKAAGFSGSLLILGAPGKGKTTLLRDLIRQISGKQGKTVAVIDERQELFPCFQGKQVFSRGPHTDILTGCSKQEGIPLALKCLGPDCIATDEITEVKDCRALTECGWCGVSLLATVHASGKEDLLSRKVYRPLVETGLFQDLLILQTDKTWKYERMTL